MNDVMALVIEKLSGVKTSESRAAPLPPLPEKINSREWLPTAREIVNRYERSSGNIPFDVRRRLIALASVPASQRHYKYELHDYEDGGIRTISEFLYIVAVCCVLREEVQREAGPLEFSYDGTPECAERVVTTLFSAIPFPVVDTYWEGWIDEGIDRITYIPIMFLGAGFVDGMDYVDPDALFEPFRLILMILMAGWYEHEIVHGSGITYEKLLEQEYNITLPEKLDIDGLSVFMRDNLREQLEAVGGPMQDLPLFLDYCLSNTGYGWLDYSQEAFYEMGSSDEFVFTAENYDNLLASWREIEPIHNRIDAFARWFEDPNSSFPQYERSQYERLQLLIRVLKRAMLMSVGDMEVGPLIDAPPEQQILLEVDEGERMICWRVWEHRHPGRYEFVHATTPARARRKTTIFTAAKSILNMSVERAHALDNRDITQEAVEALGFKWFTKESDETTDEEE